MQQAITHEESLINFYNQIDYVLNTYTAHGLVQSSFDNIVLGGLGGSGIGSKIVSDYLANTLKIPALLVGDYDLPAFANSKTLVIVSSYSGNTEETLTMLAQAQNQNCTIVAITAGGKLKQICEEHGYKTYYIETGFQPRMTLGYSLSTLLCIFAELCGTDFTENLKNASILLKNYEPLKAQAEEILNQFTGGENNKFVTVCDSATQATAIRFCQQLQENAKAEGFLSVLPEANHNMIETYYAKHATNFILINSGKNERVNLRFNFIKELLLKYNNNVVDLSTGIWGIERMYQVIYILDWVSVLLSNRRGEDNMSIANIMDLKGLLSK